MDTLRLKVEPLSLDSGGGFEVQIFVNRVEMTRAGAGIGMDPRDLLVPTNRFRATAGARRVAVARCACGVYGCGATDIVITAGDGVVHWDWQVEVPMHRRVTFDTADYERELDRFEADRSWETAERVAARLIVPAVFSKALQGQGLQFEFAADDHASTERFLVTFRLGDDYQVFVRFPWGGRSPAELAEAIAQTLRQAPATWDATWHGITPAARKREPRLAGPSWSRESL